MPLTVILQTDLETAKRHCKVHVPDAKLKCHGRFVAIQAPSFAPYGAVGLGQIAEAQRLPLVEIRDDVPPF